MIVFTCKNDNDCYGNGYCQARECKCSANYEYRQDCSNHGCKYFPCFHICPISISLFLGTRYQTFIRLYAHCSFLYSFLRWMFSLLLFCCVILFYVSELDSSLSDFGWSIFVSSFLYSKTNFRASLS